MAEFTKKQKEIFDSIESDLRRETAMAYVRNGYSNQTQAYLDACAKLGKKPSKNPITSASEILNYPNVVDFINSIKSEAAKSVNIDAEFVLKQAVKIHKICMSEGDMKNAISSLKMVGEHISVKAFDDKANETDLLHALTMKSLSEFYGKS